ncbi:MAG: hypothetical protein SOW45_01680 [Prevotella sp.]|nr:hypothetical protein [Prevotella sp.]
MSVIAVEMLARVCAPVCFMCFTGLTPATVVSMRQVLPSPPCTGSFCVVRSSGVRPCMESALVNPTRVTSPLKARVFPATGVIMAF